MPVNSAGVTLVSGMIAKSKNQDVLANNLANVNTTAYKRDEVSFHTVYDSERLIQQAEFEDRRRSLSDEVYYGHVPVDVPVIVDSVYTHREPGYAAHTANELDVVLNNKDAYFTVETDEGRKYTKAGSFSIGEEGELVTSEGYRAVGTITDLPISITGDSVRILETGEVVVDEDVVETLKIVFAENAADFTKEGDSFYRFHGDERNLQQVTHPELIPGYLEKSNVNAVREINSMTLNMRMFESEVKSLRDIARTLDRAVNGVGRT